MGQGGWQKPVLPKGIIMKNNRIIIDLPGDAAWRRVRQKVRNFIVFLILTGVLAAYLGVPHVQYEYRFKRVGDAQIKTDADYWSVSGKRVYGYGSLAERADFPFVIWVPLTEVVDFDAAWQEVVKRLDLVSIAGWGME